MKTTAIYPNRITAKEKLEKELGLPEFATGSKVIFLTKDNSILAVGYTRVVYGDHGPYVEFTKSQVCWTTLRCDRVGIGYFDKYYTPDGVLVYLQRATVAKLKNPPSDGKAEAFKGNRQEGYADYVPGMVYVDPYKVKIVMGL